ncbi:MAG: DUF960 family protein [Veillonellales bacterium]
MFTAKRYATRGITEKLGLDLQLLLWSLIDRRKKTGIEVDYLQVFELSVIQKNGVAIQSVIHKQEIPPANDIYYFPLLVEERVQGTVWAMDSEEYCMMLLPEEY